MTTEDKPILVQLQERARAVADKAQTEFDHRAETTENLIKLNGMVVELARVTERAIRELEVQLERRS